MKIAIISDTHNQYDRVERAVKRIEEFQVELTIHCGDIEDAEVVWLFPPNTHFVFGNCDRDRTSLRQAMYGTGATLHEPFGHLELAGQTLGFVHGDNEQILTDLEYSESFDYIFHGHTHQKAERKRGSTRIINPGALHRASTKTFAILDLSTGELQSVVVE